MPTTDRSKRVKDAKTEAAAEIEEYRKKKDSEFKEFEQKVRPPSLSSVPFPQGSDVEQHTSGNKKAEEDAKADGDKQVQGIKDAGGKHGDEVVKDLLRIVTEVQPVVPDRVGPPKA